LVASVSCRSPTTVGVIVMWPWRGAGPIEAIEMLIQLRGKVRRAVVGTMLSEEDRAAVASARTGDCNRCGACCKILFACPFLLEAEDGTFTCRVYDHRPASCRLFPMVPADLREVERCGFTFEKSAEGRPRDP
jgi:hypothetical protein